MLLVRLTKQMRLLKQRRRQPHEAPGMGFTTMMVRHIPLLLALVALPAAAQDVYVSNGSQVTVFDSVDDTATTFVASGAGGVSAVTGIAAGPDGLLYVASGATDTIARFDGGTGVFVDDFLANADRLRAPIGLRFATNGHLFFANRFTNEVFEADIATGVVATYTGTPSIPLITPEDIAFDAAGLLYVASANTNTILRIDPSTSVVEEFIAADAGLDYPQGLAFDSSGELFVSSHFSDEVVHFDAAGTFVEVFASVSRPAGLAFDVNGNLLVAEFGGSSVRRFNTAGTELVALPTAAPATFLSVVNRPRISSIARSPTSVAGGCENAVATVTIDRPAPVGGIIVRLTSDNVAATIPATLAIPEGSTTGTAAITTTQVATRQVVSLAASFGASSKRTSLTVNPIGLASGTAALTANPTSIAGGASSTGTVLLECAPPTSPVTVTLASDTPAVASVPASVTVNPGSTSATFTIATTPPAASTSVILSATLNRTATRTITVNQTTSISALSFAPSTVLGGNNSTGTVTLSAPAPAGGAVLTLTSAAPGTVSVPATVTVAAGATSATFIASTVPVASQVGVQVVARFGAASKARSLFVRPGGVSLVTLTPSTIRSGQTSAGVVTLEQAAVGNVVVTLTSAAPAVANPTTSTVTVLSGQTTANFTVLAGTVTVRTSTRITASANGVSALRTIIVNP